MHVYRATCIARCEGQFLCPELSFHIGVILPEFLQKYESGGRNSLRGRPTWCCEHATPSADFFASSAFRPREATTLIARDPTLSAASQMFHHSILGVIANGSVADRRSRQATHFCSLSTPSSSRTRLNLTSAIRARHGSDAAPRAFIRACASPFSKIK